VYAGDHFGLAQAQVDPPAEPHDDPGNPSIDFRCERRSNATQTSTTDPEARLYKKAKDQQAKRCDLGHVLIANHQGLAVHIRVPRITGTAERDALVAMLAGFPRQHQIASGPIGTLMHGRWCTSCGRCG
jgi:hypothetical protein